MKNEEDYEPLSERVQQDVMHDNFIPKYSGLATAKPNLVVLVGTYLIFVPMLLGALVMGLQGIGETSDTLALLLTTSIAIFFAVLAGTILIVQTRRYRRYRSEESAED